ncbi:MAG: serine/threonine protein kinase [Gammaproteobacteria bacterium]
MEIPGYKIQREIGRGGMATVYLAIQESLERPVVLKILDAVNMDQSEELAERFLTEGRILASLNHPNIITIFDIGIADNTLYISMEYVQGGDLKQRLELTISPGEALHYLTSVASALGEAHKHGIVHRDVKPANILFKDEVPLLTDFGIAKQVDADSDLTSTGIFLGSPNYVSPEQADGIKLDGRADIYSLGCIFYEMLMGKKPYISDSVIDIVIQHKQAPIPMLPRDLKEYQLLLNRLLAKQRSERYPDAEALIADIEKIQKKNVTVPITSDFDITGDRSSEATALRQKRAKQILFSLILLSMVLFSSLKYVEVRIKGKPVNIEQVSTDTVLSASPIRLPVYSRQGLTGSTGQTGSVDETVSVGETANTGKNQAVSKEIVNALVFLGKQSLEEYKLTYPPKDNAYYYYSRLLQIDPGNRTAIKGIYEISDRYSFLAEQSLINNEYQKTSAYVDIGLRINPKNQALLEMKSLIASQNSSIIGTLKSLFSRK